MIRANPFKSFLQAQARDFALLFGGDLHLGFRIVGHALAQARENFGRGFSRGADQKNVAELRLIFEIGLGDFGERVCRGLLRHGLLSRRPFLGPSRIALRRLCPRRSADDGETLRANRAARAPTRSRRPPTKKSSSVAETGGAPSSPRPILARRSNRAGLCALCAAVELVESLDCASRASSRRGSFGRLPRRTREIG